MDVISLLSQVTMPFKSPVVIGGRDATGQRMWRVCGEAQSGDGRLVD